MSSKIKFKPTYGGYKEVGQYGLGDLATIQDYQKLANTKLQPMQPKSYTPYTPQDIVPVEAMPVIQPLTPSSQSNDYSGATAAIGNVANAGFSAYNKFNEIRGKLAYGISQGIAGASAIAGMFDEAQLRRREQEQKIQSLQNQAYENNNRGLNNVPAYTQYGGGSDYNVEAEKGEVYDNDGDILKISDSAPSHDEGGVNIVADRVLENTSTRRKDEMSQALKLSKEQVSLMSGFEAKKAMSHSEAYEFEAAKNAKLQKKFLDAIVKTTSASKVDQEGINSAKLNVELGLSKLPTENQIFDKYFESQESIKNDMGFYDGKLEAKYGKAEDGYYNPYKTGKQKTPTGKNSNFPADKDAGLYIQNWNQVLGKNYGINDVYPLQYDSYTYALENNPDAVRDMWKTYGLNNKAQQNGVNYDVNNLSNDQLLSLREQYTDGLLGTRLLNGFLPEATVTAQREPLANRQISSPNLPLPEVATPPITPQTQSPTVGQALGQAAQTVAEEFRSPMQWYDTIGPNMQILSALRRDPELYNQVNISDINLQQQDVRPALNNNQAEYNAAIQNLSNDSVGAAQRAQIFSNKLRADNQIIGQYENANKQIQNQETQYNANARDRQEAANAQSRESYYTKVLQGRAKQEEQLLTGIDSLAKTYAERRAFERNANLIMKLAPNMNEKGEYNGVPVRFASSSGTQPGFATNSSGQPQVNEKGQYLLRTRNKEGKVTEEYVSKDYYDRITGNASAKQVENKLIMNIVNGKGIK